MTDATSGKYLGWVLKLGKIEFDRTLGWQHGLVKLRREGMARDTIILVEHPPVITVGKDGHKENFESLECEPVFINFSQIPLGRNHQEYRPAGHHIFDEHFGKTLNRRSCAAVSGVFERACQADTGDHVAPAGSDEKHV